MFLGSGASASLRSLPELSQRVAEQYVLCLILKLSVPEKWKVENVMTFYRLLEGFREQVCNWT